MLLHSPGNLYTTHVDIMLVLQSSMVNMIFGEIGGLHFMMYVAARCAE